MNTRSTTHDEWWESEAVVTSPQPTYAERLRGQRFWLPLIALAAATTIGAVAFHPSHSPSSSIALAKPSVAHLDPVVRKLVTTLAADQVYCGSLQTARPSQASCVLGSQPTRAYFASYPTHRLALRAASRVEQVAHDQFVADHSVRYLIVGRQWTVVGTWSAAGQYATDTTPAAVTAKTVSGALNGCMELLPKEHGSCIF